MERSESLKELGKALSAFGAELTTIQHNATNPFHKATYADLRAILEAAKPVMSRHGLSVAQFPFGAGGLVGVETILLHSSGEWLAQYFEMPLQEQKGQSIQQAGSYITYLRRYAFASVLGLATGDPDPDGVVPKAPAPKAPTQKAPAENAGFDLEAFRTYIGGLNKEHKMLSVGQRGVMVGVLNTTFGGDDGRHKFLEWVSGKASIKEIAPEAQYAIWEWLSIDESGLPSSKAIETSMSLKKELGI